MPLLRRSSAVCDSRENTASAKQWHTGFLPISRPAPHSLVYQKRLALQRTCASGRQGKNLANSRTIPLYGVLYTGQQDARRRWKTRIRLASFASSRLCVRQFHSCPRHRSCVGLRASTHPTNLRGGFVIHDHILLPLPTRCNPLLPGLVQRGENGGGDLPCVELLLGNRGHLATVEMMARFDGCKAVVEMEMVQ